MDAKYKQRIQQNYVTLLQDTNAADITPHLWMNQAISENDKERIEKHLGRHEQNTEFYSIICKKGNHAYRSLIQAMITTKQGHLAQLLVISENEGRTESFTMSDVVTEEMSNGLTRFKIRSIEVNDLTNERAVAVPEESAVQTEDSNKVLVKVAITGFTCEPIEMSMSREDSMVKIKEFVDAVCGIDVGEQALTYQNTLVSDEETIVNACGAISEVSFSVMPKFVFPEPGLFSVEVVLFDEDSEPKVCLNVSGRDDIKKLKAKLRLSHPQNVPYYQLHLVFNGEECKEGHSVTDCGITEGSTISCCVRRDYFLLRIRDTTSNANITLPVTGSLKIGDLNQSISHTRNVSSAMCELFYRGKRLPDEQMLLEIDKRSSLLKTGMTMTLVMPGMILISVRYMGNERSMDCYVRWNDTVLSLKQEICEVMDITLEDHVLIYAGKTLEDENLVHDYGINKASNVTVFVFPTVSLVELTVTLLISDDLQPTHVIQVPPEVTVKELKLYISWKLLIQYPQFLEPDTEFYLSVCRTEEIMDDDLTSIQSLGLKNGDKVTVMIQLGSSLHGSCTESVMTSTLSSETSFYCPDKGFMDCQPDPFVKSGLINSFLNSTLEVPVEDGDFLKQSDGLSNVDSLSGSLESSLVEHSEQRDCSLHNKVDVDSSHADEVEDDSGVESKSFMESCNRSGMINSISAENSEQENSSHLHNKVDVDSSHADKVEDDSGLESESFMENYSNSRSIESICVNDGEHENSNSLHNKVDVKLNPRGNKMGYGSRLEVENSFSSSYSRSQVREVSELRARPDVEMSNVSLRDLSDALLEDGNDDTYSSCYEAWTD